MISKKKKEGSDVASMSLGKSDDGPIESDRGFYRQDSLGQQTKKILHNCEERRFNVQTE